MDQLGTLCQPRKSPKDCRQFPFDAIVGVCPNKEEGGVGINHDTPRSPAQNVDPFSSPTNDKEGPTAADPVKGTICKNL